MNRHGFQRLVGLSAILMTALVAGNVVTLFVSVGNDLSVFSDASRLLPMGSRGVQLFHVSMILDVLGYLAFAPLAVFC